MQPLAQLSGPLSPVTVEVLPPLLVTVRVYEVTKVRVIVRLALIVTTHVVDESSQASDPVPDHPVKSEPLAGTAVRVTAVPLSKFALQVLDEEQAIPSGEELTVPLPEPVKLVVSVLALNVAATYRAWDIVTVHVEEVPLHTPPLQPVKSAESPEVGVAVSTTAVPEL